MDIKTAFLNDNLDEDIYMMQPNDFIVKGHKSIWYASCIDPFMDLSKLLEVGTFTFIR